MLGIRGAFTRNAYVRSGTVSTKKRNSREPNSGMKVIAATRSGRSEVVITTGSLRSN